MLTIENLAPHTLLELLMEILTKLDNYDGSLDKAKEELELACQTAKAEIQALKNELEYKMNNLDNIILDEVVDQFNELVANGVIADIIGTEVLDDMYTQILLVNNNVESLRRSMGFVNVMDYGAKGDGKTNDTNAFKKAIQSSNRVYVPSGRYLISKLAITKSVIIEGDSTTYAWREQTTGTGSVIVVKDIADDEIAGGFINATWNEGGNSLTLRNLTFEGQTEKRGVGVYGRWDCIIENCLFRKLRMGIRDYHASRIINSVFEHCEYGIYGMTDVIVNGCAFCICGIGLCCYENSGNYNLITGCRIEYCYNIGIEFNKAVFNSVIGCQLDKNDYGIKLINATQTLISGCHFDRNVQYHLTFEGENGSLITGCHFIKRNTSDSGNAVNKPDYAIKLISYGNSTVSCCASNHKIFDKSYYQYKGGELIVDGTISPYIGDYRTTGEPESL